MSSHESHENAQPSAVAQEQKRASLFSITAFELLALVLILLLGLLLRFAYFSEIVEKPDYASPVLDAWTHDYWARAMLSGNWTPRAGIRDPKIYDTPYVRPPGYPYFLAAVYAVSAGSYGVIRWVQFAIGLMNCVLLFFLGRALFGRGVGLLSAFLLSCYWGFIFFEGELQAPAVVIFLTLSLFLVACGWIRRLTLTRGLLAGLLTGLLTLFRPEVLLLIPLVPIWGWWASRSQKPRKRVWVALLASLVGAALMIAPVTLRNYRVTGEVLLVTLGAGFNLYAGNNPDAKGTYPYIDMQEPLGISRRLNNNEMPIYLDAYRNKMGDETLGYADLSRFFSKLALEYIKENPWHTVKQMARKGLYYWGPMEISNNKVLDIERKDSPTLKFLPRFSWVSVLSFLGLLMLWRYGRKDLDQHKLLYPMLALVTGYIFIRFASVLPLFVAGRYRIQIVPFLILFAAYALYHMGRLLRSRQWGEFTIWAPVAVGLILALGIPWISYTPSLAMWHWSRGLAHVSKQDREPAKAVEEFKLAAKAVGNTGALHRGVLFNEVALMLLELNKIDEALEWSDRAIELYPTFAPAYNTHGFILKKSGKGAESIPYFEKAIELDFLLSTARHNLGNTLVDAYHYEYAIKVYKEVLEVDPQDPDADYNLGRVYSRMGDHENALKHYKLVLEKHDNEPVLMNSLAYELWQNGNQAAALAYFQELSKVAPDFLQARHNLGNLLVELERYEEAIQTFEAILILDPDDYYATFNHGRALALSGQREEAIAEFRKAVEKNPRHAEAHNYLGYELELAGETEEAKGHYEAALQLAPNFRLAQENLHRLREKEKAKPLGPLK